MPDIDALVQRLVMCSDASHGGPQGAASSSGVPSGPALPASRAPGAAEARAPYLGQHVLALPMATTTDAGGPLSLVGITVRRSFATGRFYLVYAIVMSLIFVIAMGFAGGASFDTVVPLLLPVFAVVGSMGGLTVFTNDRLKGVLEYLMAYGISPRRLFVNILLASMVLLTTVLGFALGVGLGLLVARKHAVAFDFALLLIVYALPMSYASVAFAATVGMFWTSLSSPRTAINSPIGLAPLVGILPSMATLFAVVALSATGHASGLYINLVFGGAVGLIAVVVILLLSMIGRLLRRERLLSPT